MSLDDLQALEADYEAWLRYFFPAAFSHKRTGKPIPLALHHHEYWQWVWRIEPGELLEPFIGEWARGGGKSTGAEIAVIALAARQKRRYGLYISGTEESANKHVESIGNKLRGNPRLADAYPDICRPDVYVEGPVKGWRRNRLICKSGFVLDAYGLRGSVRGIKFDDDRPDFEVLDDVDAIDDSIETVDDKEQRLTQDILPAGSNDCVVLGIQNPITTISIFARLAGIAEQDRNAEYLSDRYVSGPIPAATNLTYDTHEVKQPNGMTRLRYTVTSGTPTWLGQDLEDCQALINRMGLTAFRRECLHQIEAPAGGMFTRELLGKNIITWEQLAAVYQRGDIVRAACWLDPAVTNKKTSDSQAFALGAIDKYKTKYLMVGWEQRSSPHEALKLAIEKGAAFNVAHVGIETDQGGDVWQAQYRQSAKAAALAAGQSIPPMAWEKAGAGYGNKVHRASLIQAGFERGEIKIVIGTHDTVIRALLRFPKTPPYDLVDAISWLVADLDGRMDLTEDQILTISIETEDPDELAYARPAGIERYREKKEDYIRGYKV